MARKRGDGSGPQKPIEQDARHPAWDLVEIAMAETKEALSADPSRSCADPTLPIFRVYAVMKLERCRRQFEVGDRLAMLAAVRICANHDLVMPPWLSQAFISAYDRGLNFEVSSWDEAFGPPVPKGKHRLALKKRRELEFKVLNEVNKRIRAGVAVSDSLFEEVGRLVNIGKTQAAEYYYGARAKMTPNERRIDGWIERGEVPQRQGKLRNY